MNRSPTLTFPEIILALSGIFIIVSVAVVSVTGDFTLWVLAKVFYGIGVLVLLLKWNHVRG